VAARPVELLRAALGSIVALILMVHHLVALLGIVFIIHALMSFAVEPRLLLKALLACLPRAAAGISAGRG